ncbi:murein biosynthesis integral membrane protein MurJ [Clostridium septicum]|uniref:Probable lipid II flippase MurJ n=1 Tax=Clostridium septicum TaxID=1504 RepID=A0A9N7JJX6_CLOSE|nr:murein biosynthesis integral membrane protein MurJ [Clostridium septicum]AYE33888.1 murein biosynthesis integral membrane protein MurJ [Clostridium septicum]UEC21504.1 murein biosynthesis integral membrane protein MurJ [Clostridium septicum]USS00449.1 murein biosynthesis integral membrane protein MurJ [Clostridium septicum]
MRDKKNSTIFITITLIISNVLVKFLGLARDVVLANTYGTSMYSDAYIVANNIPVVIFSIVAVAISTAFIPIYSEIKEKYGEEKALKFTNNFINIVLVICLIITILGELFPAVLVKVFAYGFTNEAYELTLNFTKILIPTIIVTALMSISGSYLQLKGDFIPISYVTIPNNLIVIISIYIAYYKGSPYILAIGTSIAIISQIIYYYPFMKRNEFKYEFYINLKDEHLKKILIMIIPVFIGTAVNEVNVIVDRSLVSGLEQGSIASLNYASKLTGFITGVFIVSIVTVVYPKMSNLSAKKEFEKLNCYLKNVLIVISLLLLPITIMCIFYSKDVVQIIFERGSFDSKSTYMTAMALSSYCIGLIGIGFREILTKAYFSLKDTKTPMINGAIGVGVNIILNIILIRKIGFIGSALATSVTAIITVLLLINKIQLSIGKIFDKEFNINLLKILICSFISVVGCNLIYRNINNDTSNIILHSILLMIVIIITFVIYIILLVLFKNEEVIKFKDLLLDKIKGRNF